MRTGAPRGPVVGNAASLLETPDGPTATRAGPPEEAQALLRAARTSRQVNLFRISPLLGLCPGEAAALRWPALHLHDDLPTADIIGRLQRLDKTMRLLRYAAASLMSAGGMRLEDISNPLSHRSVTVTAEIYRHPIAALRIAQVGAMDALLSPIWPASNSSHHHSERPDRGIFLLRKDPIPKLRMETRKLSSPRPQRATCDTGYTDQIDPRNLTASQVHHPEPAGLRL